MTDASWEHLAGRARVFVIGNSGSGKSTLARRLASRLQRAHIDLDGFAFLDQIGTRRPVADSLAQLEAIEGFDRAVIEGCYADLVGAAAAPEDHLVWLDLSVSDCTANAEGRPWEPHKWPSREQQDAFLPNLLEFIARYPEDVAPTGRPAHAALYDSFPGTRERHDVRPPLPGDD